MKREEVKDLVDRGIRELSEALAAGKSDRLQEYLALMARFPKYSFNNCLLLLLQFPEATLVQGFYAWKKIGRTVKKGEKGIGIIAPMVGRKKDDDDDTSNEKTLFGFKVVHVFDISQTEGDALPEFATITGDPGEHIGAIEQLIQSAGIELVYEPISSGADGVSQKGKIVVVPGLQPAKRMAVLLHEYAHETLHSNEQRRKETTKTIRETEAEAVAHVVCQALGLQSIEHCTDYIQLYNGDVEVLTNSMDHIQKTAVRILDGIKAHLTDNASQLTEVSL